MVPINREWKIPVAYFAIKALNAFQRATLTIESIERLYNIRVRIISTTNDGPVTNRATMTTLGSKIYFHKEETCEPWFTHPSCPDWKVFTYLDAPHAAKCVRSALKVYF